MREYAQRQGWGVLEEFVEPGASARTAERPVLKQLLARCKAEPPVDVVLVHKIDRLARNMYDHATIKALLKRGGIRLTSVVENVDDSITGQLVENIMASLAEFYSANLGEEVKKGMRMKIQRGGWPHKPPLGYHAVKADGGRSRVEPEPLLGALMREAFELYSSGYYSLKQLAKELASRGLTTSVGNPLPCSHLNVLLRNRFYLGELVWKGEAHPGNHEPLVAQDVFARVQRQLSARAQRGSTRYGSLEFWLKGIAFCAACGSKMTAERHGAHAYYRCLANIRGRKRCAAPFSNAERIHQKLKAAYRAIELSPALKERILNTLEASARTAAERRSQSLRSLRVAHAKMKARLARLAETYAAGGMEHDTYVALTSKWQRVLKGVDAAMASLIDAPQEMISAERLLRGSRSIWDLHLGVTATQRALLVKAVFSKISISDDGVEAVTLKPPFDGASRGGDESAESMAFLINQTGSIARTA